jgi:hypothetical protein
MMGKGGPAMNHDLGITVLVIHFADGRRSAFNGGYFTSSYWWPSLLWGPGVWRYLSNDNGKGELRCL